MEEAIFNWFWHTHSIGNGIYWILHKKPHLVLGLTPCGIDLLLLNININHFSKTLIDVEISHS